MRKARLAVVGMLIAFLGACSGGRPSQSEREFAFLQFVKENSNDEARIEDFKSNQCQKADGAPSYTCDASAKVKVLGQDFGNQMDGVYTFTKVGGTWKITARVQ